MVIVIKNVDGDSCVVFVGGRPHPSDHYCQVVLCGHLSIQGIPDQYVT